jgi:hypothetical protein
VSHTRSPSRPHLTRTFSSAWPIAAGPNLSIEIDDIVSRVRNR